MKLFGREWTRREVERRVGDISQLGSVDLLTCGEGPARGVRVLQFRCGTGFSFRVAVERGLDVGQCEYQGASVAWIPPTGLPGPWYFEDQAGFGWLRTALGGLINSCGMQHIGDPDSLPVPQYRYAPRPVQHFGVHDRAALLPGELLSYGSRWDGNDLILEAVGRTVQAQAYGESLCLTRTYRARLGESRFSIHDRIENRGFQPAQHMWLYHINIGFPFVDAGSRFVAPLADRPGQFIDNSDSSGGVVGRHDLVVDPQPDWVYEGYDLAIAGSPTRHASVAIVNDRLGPSGQGVYLRWNLEQLPRFVEWRMMGEGQYVIGIEPCTNRFGREDAEAAGELRMLEPGSSVEYDLEMGVLDGQEEIDAFLIGLPLGAAENSSR